jgi:hypothetical protein
MKPFDQPAVVPAPKFTAFAPSAIALAAGVTVSWAMGMGAASSAAIPALVRTFAA